MLHVVAIYKHVHVICKDPQPLYDHSHNNIIIICDIIEISLNFAGEAEYQLCPQLGYRRAIPWHSCTDV